VLSKQETEHKAVLSEIPIPMGISDIDLLLDQYSRCI